MTKKYMGAYSNVINFKRFLEEKILSIGFNPEHEKKREEVRPQVAKLLQQSYKEIGGYAGFASGSDEESQAIHNDISSCNMKVTKREDAVTSVVLYRDKHGRKSVGIGTDGTMQGKKDLMDVVKADHKLKRSWSEVSGAPEKIKVKLGTPYVPKEDAPKLTGKKDIQFDDDDPYHYTRQIGDRRRTKAIVGYPKYDPTQDDASA